VPQAWCVDSLNPAKKAENANTLDQLAAILKDYPDLYCECRGSTDADPTKDPEPGLVAHFKLNSTQLIQDELARNRAVACKEGLVARGVPNEQLVVTWEGCGAESGVNFRPILSGDALQMLRAEVALLREKLTNADSGTPVDRTAAALKRVQDLLKGNAIQFDGAGSKTTQTSALGVPQAWNLDSLNPVKKGKNADTLDQLAAILKEYPELYCNLHGSTDADPTKQPDAGLAAHFKQDTTQSIQDELARNRAVACKEGLVARGVPGQQLVATWKGCGEESKVDFTPMLPGDALGEEVAMLRTPSNLSTNPQSRQITLQEITLQQMTLQQLSSTNNPETDLIRLRS
jgi:outer membrane protein OmpA-like peptidoglycan-associated protein